MRLLQTLACAILVLLQSAALATRPEYGQPPAPPDRLEYVDGSPVDLAALRGKPVLLYVGADWCEPCQTAGRPATERMRREYGDLGLEIILVSMDDNKFRANKLAEASTRGIRIAMPRLALCPPHKCPDGLRNLGDFGHIYGYPSAYLLDAEGRVHTKLVGGMSIRMGIEAPVRAVLRDAGLLSAAR